MVAGKVEGRTYGVANIEFVTEPDCNVNVPPVTDNPLEQVNNPVQLIAGRVEGRLYGDANIEFVIEPAGRLTVPDFTFNPLIRFISSRK